jgi:hypothetical protein
VRAREAGNSGVGSRRLGVASRRDFFASVLADGAFMALGEAGAVRSRASDTKHEDKQDDESDADV